MGLFNLFNNSKKYNYPKEYLDILELGKSLDTLFECDQYIAKSNYADLLDLYKDVIDYFNVLTNSNMLKDFCRKNRINKNTINEILDRYCNIEKYVDEHNEKYIINKLKLEKVYLDNILKEVDPVIVLDENQRRVVLTDEDHCLVIAGAGAGKTTTVAAKVKYLVEKQNIKANEILVVSFTNKAVEELRDKINKDLKIDCIISTFHSIGNAILRNQSNEKLNIVRENKLYFLLQDYFKSNILSNESLMNNLVLFFSSYFDAPCDCDDFEKIVAEYSKSNYSTLKSDLNEFKKKIIDIRTKKSITIQNEVVRSYQEVEIANFLYLNNIDYEYEPIYRYNIKYSNKPYTPDFLICQNDKRIYIEHFALSQNGKNNMFNNDQIEKYKKAINDKVALHKEHNTKLIYTFSEYNDGRDILEHLREELIKNGIELRPKSNKEVIEKIISVEENRYIRKLINLICKFINNFKTNGFTDANFEQMKNSTENVRNKLFLDICKECYLVYSKYLKENNLIDFQDMINESASVLKNMENDNKKLHFKYVIVDEYQDISRQRFDLVSAMKNVCDAKIIAVGDDWQSIYAFSGSDIRLFTQFSQKMGYAKMLKIEMTYRNSQDIIDIAGNFIQKNKTQIEKTLKSPKTIDTPVSIYTYDSSKKEVDSNNKSGKNYSIACAVERALDDLIAFNKKENTEHKNKVLLLGRFGFDADKLQNTGLFEVHDRGSIVKSIKHPNLKITFMTAHASKGLGYDNVVVINGINGTYGFPSKIQNDPVMKFVLVEDNSIDYAEERRLFYVAMTRTKNRVFFIAPEEYPSEFLIEIKNDYPKVKMCGEWNEEIIQKHISKTCPICGFPMQFRYKNSYGLRLHICMNEPEVCGFMTNEIGGGKLPIIKCDQCNDGYLVVKRSGDDYFLGCTNYENNKKGCNNTITKENYYKMKNLSNDIEVKSKYMNNKNKDMSIKMDDNESNIKFVPTKRFDELSIEEYRKLCNIIILCVKHVSQKKFYGVTMITSILKGGQKSKKSDVAFEQLPEYGVLYNIGSSYIEGTIHWLVINGYLLRTKGRYPVLHITSNSDNFNKLSDKKLYDGYNFCISYVKEKAL